MITEVYDPSSGAILFKKDEESIDIETLKIKVQDLEDRIQYLERCIKYLIK